MKVYIGKYPNWIGPYQVTAFLFEWWLGEKRSDEIANWLSYSTPIGDWMQKLHDLKTRKVKVKIHDYDVWNADDTLAHVIYPLLIKIKENKNSSPLVDDKDVPKELRSTSAPPKENEWDIDDNYHKRWEYILDEMIWAFGTIVSSDDPQFSSGTSNLVSVGYDKDGNKTEDEDQIAWYSYEEGPNHTYKIDRKKWDQWEKRRAKAFALFGKYYLSLWT